MESGGLGSKKLILILGGARAGKTDFALRRAKACAGPVLYVATAAPGDAEMRRRIARHQKARPKEWRTLEATAGVAEALAHRMGDARLVLIDCLTVLVANLLAPAGERGEMAPDGEALESRVAAEVEGLLSLYASSQASFIIVSNEVGMGLVPPYPLGRAYRDLLGQANQRVAAAADEVYLLFAGLPLELKSLAALGPGRAANSGVFVLPGEKSRRRE